MYVHINQTPGAMHLEVRLNGRPLELCCECDTDEGWARCGGDDVDVPPYLVKGTVTLFDARNGRQVLAVEHGEFVYADGGRTCQQHRLPAAAV